MGTLKESQNHDKGLCWPWAINYTTNCTISTKLGFTFLTIRGPYPRKVHNYYKKAH